MLVPADPHEMPLSPQLYLMGSSQKKNFLDKLKFPKCVFSCLQIDKTEVAKITSMLQVIDSPPLSSFLSCHNKVITKILTWVEKGSIHKPSWKVWTTAQKSRINILKKLATFFASINQADFNSESSLQMFGPHPEPKVKNIFNRAVTPNCIEIWLFFYNFQ